MIAGVPGQLQGSLRGLPGVGVGSQIQFTDGVPVPGGGEGALIGELALVTETVYSATAIAVEPTIVIRISRSLFCKVLEGFPNAARLMRDRFAERANMASGELSRLRAILEKPRPQSQ